MTGFESLRGALLLLILSASASSAKVVRLGIMAGHNVGFAGDQGLKFAVADAEKMSRLFRDVGGMEPEDVVLLRSPRPEDLDRAFETLSLRAASLPSGDEAVFVFYYSGHGDRERLKLGRKAYPLARLKERIDRVPAKVRIGILDACQSGAITRIKGARMVAPFLLEQDLRSAGTILIASSAEDENSQEGDQLRGSFFTHHWHSALRGAGDASGDGQVSLLEAYQFAYNRTVVHTQESRGGAQHPNAQFKLDTEGDVILTDLKSGLGGIRFARELEGDLLVANHKAEVMAEMSKAKGGETFLALPPGRYRVFHREGKRTRQGRVAVEGAEIRVVSARDLATDHVMAAKPKGGTQPEDEVRLPWKVEDLSTQAPLEFGFGFDRSGSSSDINARLGYKFHPHLAVTGTYTSQTVGYAKDEFRHFRLGFQVSKFVSPNLECLGTLYHRAAHIKALNDDFENLRREETWDLAAGTGFSGAVRFWFSTFLSFQIQYGTEYRRGDGGFSADNVIFMPGLHF